ncbi:MAG: M14 family metallopeptidase [Planctomycetota bacterium]|nr:M14 family metallopeptidase [Planctomycetota bacterium]
MRVHGRRGRTAAWGAAIAGAMCGGIATPVAAQQQIEAEVDLAHNRYYDFEEMTDALRRLAEAHPELATLVSLGESVQGRPMWLLAINNPETGSDREKPAIWIDGNIHGNEVQAAETVLYTAWYLLEAYDEVPAVRELVDERAFYLVPMVNPDGRAGWFDEAHTPNSNRSGLQPTDNDRDGLLDEDGPEDLDGDGHIGRMWRPDPNGTHRRNERDPRIFERVPRVPGPDGRIMTGDWSMAGSVGIDNDGDGRINEDGEGGYDMNRNFPSDWQPDHVQRGAGTHPFSYPETRAIGDFIRAHPNIAAGQSYHNTGGMLLRGPGADYNESAYARPDRAVYDALGEAGEEMLPHYDYLVIHSDLYRVHGGCVNWMAEGLGIVSFTNELWTDRRIMQDGEGRMDEEARFRWQDRMLFGQTFTDWTEVDHPDLGPVLVGGGTKYSRRTPPPFMLEEESHRNFAFTMYHADQMPLLRVGDVVVEDLGDGLWQVDVEIENDRLIPTRTARAASKRIGRPDLLLFEPGEGSELVLAGPVSNRFAERFTPVEHRPERLLVENGVPGRGRVTFRYILESEEPPTGRVTYAAEKARDLDFRLGGP